MNIRRLVTPTVIALALVVGLLAFPALGQVPDDFHTPSPEVGAEVEVAGVVLERGPAEAGPEVGAEVLGVTIRADTLARTGTDALLLTLIGISLVGLGIVAFWTGRRTAGREGSGAAS
jgi:hypothetical protein